MKPAPKTLSPSLQIGWTPPSPEPRPQKLDFAGPSPGQRPDPPLTEPRPLDPGPRPTIPPPGARAPLSGVGPRPSRSPAPGPATVVTVGAFGGRPAGASGGPVGERGRRASSRVFLPWRAPPHGPGWSACGRGAELGHRPRLLCSRGTPGTCSRGRRPGSRTGRMCRFCTGRSPPDPGGI